MSSFTAWLARQDHRDDPVGDLARDLDADPRGPADDHVTTVIDYVATVASTSATSACIAASQEWAENAWRALERLEPLLAPTEGDDA